MSCLFYAIEDNPDDVIFLKRAFDSSCCDLKVFGDVQAAIGAINDPELEYPNVLLVDLNLPGATGIELIKAARNHKRTKTVPVVVLSSSSYQGDIDSAYAAGASSYVVKPVDYAELEAAIKTIAEYWGTINAPANGDAR